MTEQELVKQWLQPGAIVPVDANTTRILITALRERLAQPEQDVWQWEEIYKDNVLVERRMKRGPDCGWEPWHTPRREWVGLTDDELEMLELKHAPPVHPEFVKDDDWWEFARAIEAKLKEKNT
jgi:hypothetical protein